MSDNVNKANCSGVPHAAALAFTGEDPAGGLGLRASTAEDRDFLHAVYESTRIGEFLGAGWSAAEARTLLASQFTIQDTYYRRHYREARFDVIRRGAMLVGRLYHDWSGAEARVIDIALLPVHRGAGLGTQLMRAVVARAARKSMPVRLYVESHNPVCSLYRRLGFQPAGENGVYQLMRREVRTFEDDGAANRIAGL